ncbi:protein NRT1/ PTR FAMILY 2.13 [Neltuma alba]|uniref:protein NRT1/ PTR FAMILY 2.13 n=1 Tax=Neltuma alba TaxID=207710 RepID=UPI0010A580FE|nr:protein NRT1/ PTR FAMILY 2.13-like [Prosopis alba]XP_028792524.1 protein NRT1/ PTR FAMILY 2.13-like [Prosopis alba]XP_028792525.1 protein NRT1/ PTR FAMILY 2.13-like [Prosopis alba]
MSGSSADDKETKSSSSSSSWWLLCCRNCICSSSSSDKQEGGHQKKKQPGGWRAMPFILGNETFERLAVFGLFANFMVYLTRELHMDQVFASNIMNLWFGLTNFAPLLGAFISDAYAGRFKTIAYASVASLLGMITVTLTAWLPNLHPPSCTPEQLAQNQCVKANSTHLGVLILGLCFLTIGSAGIRPCSIPFGVDQFDPTTSAGKKGINSFFNWYYTTFTVVLLITQTVVVYIQDSVSWKIGFGIPTVCMFLSIIMFLVGRRIYVHVKPEGSIFSGIAEVLVAAYKKRHVELPSDEKVDGVFYDPPLQEGSSFLSKLPLTDQFRSLNKACLIMEGELNPDGTRVNQWRLTSIQQVEEVKCLARTFPIWAAGILSLTSMAQQGTFTISQALKMNRHLGPKFQIPAGSVGVISFLTIGLWVPFYDRFVVPSLRKITKHEGGITLLQRIGIGMVFSILSMIVAGMVEKVRRDSANSNPNPLGIAPMSVIWLAPQLILMGMCEAFNIIGQIEFFNRQFPEHMRSIANSLFSCSFAGANYVSTILVTAVHRTTRTHTHPDWLTNDINDGRLDYFYYLIAVIAALNMVYFLLVARQYRYKPTDVDFAPDVELASHKG